MVIYIRSFQFSEGQRWDIWMNYNITNTSFLVNHYCDFIMDAMASQITGLPIVYSVIHSGANQTKHQSSALLAFCAGSSPVVNSPHKWPVTRKCFHLMTSSCSKGPHNLYSISAASIQYKQYTLIHPMPCAESRTLTGRYTHTLRFISNTKNIPWFWCHLLQWRHNGDIDNDVIMSAMASQITSVAIVYSTVYSGADQRKHQSSASLAFVRGIHRWPVNSPHKWPATRKRFPLDDVIMNNITMVILNVFASHNTVIRPGSIVLVRWVMPD